MKLSQSLTVMTVSNLAQGVMVAMIIFFGGKAGRKIGGTTHYIILVLMTSKASTVVYLYIKTHSLSLYLLYKTL